MTWQCSPLVVIDLEATCWQGDKQPHEQEIIQIGWAKVDTYKDPMKLTALGSKYVLPTEGYISEFCTELTGIKNEDLQLAPTLEHLLQERFPNLGFQAVDRPWASWGRWDLNQFKRECDRKNIPQQFRGYNHVNLKALHSLVNPKKNQKGLARALSSHDMEFVGKHHNAKWDALNAARVFAKDVKRDFDWRYMIEWEDKND